MSYFSGWKAVEVEGATLQFYEKTEGEIKFLGFDSSAFTPPIPMVNALAGLNIIKDRKTKLVMINHKYPAGLIPKITDKYEDEHKELDNGTVEIIFTLREGATGGTEGTSCQCSG